MSALGLLKGRYTAACGAQATLAFEKQANETKRIIAQGDRNSPWHWWRALRASGSGRQLALPAFPGDHSSIHRHCDGEGARPHQNTLQASLSKPQLPSGSGQTLPCLDLFQGVQEMCAFRLSRSSPEVQLKQWADAGSSGFRGLLLSLPCSPYFGLVVTFICS